MEIGGIFYIFLVLLLASSVDSFGHRSPHPVSSIRSPRLSVSPHHVHYFSNPQQAETNSDFRVYNKEMEDQDLSKAQSVEKSPPPPLSPVTAFLTLNTVAILWGTQHAVIKSSISSFDSTSLLNFWRFSSSALLFSPALVTTFYDWKESRGKQVPSSPPPSSSPPSTSASSVDSLLAAGAELGIYTFLGFALQAIGLETTSATRSAFLLYLNVKLVPIFAFVLLGRKVSTNTWISALLAFSGTALLASDNGPPVIGDLYCIAAAAASAMFILRLENFSGKHDAAKLNGVSFAVVALLCGMWVLGDYMNDSNIVEGGGGGGDGIVSGFNLGDFLSSITSPLVENLIPVLYLGIISTALCNYLQTLGQRVIPASRAAVIYSMDPVYGAFFSWLLLGESIGVQGLIGAALILCGVVFSSKDNAVASDVPSEGQQ